MRVYRPDHQACRGFITMMDIRNMTRKGSGMEEYAKYRNNKGK